MSHECACEHCHPKRFLLPAERQGEGHVSVRFKDHQQRPFLEVHLNGEKELFALEAMAGRPGWVIRVSREKGGRHLCPNCAGKWLPQPISLAGGACIERVEGLVQIVSAVPA